MDQYGFIKDGKVVNTAIFDDPTPEILEEFRVLHNVDELVKSYHRNCEVGATYDGTNFILPKPEDHPSFVLDDNFNWVPPIEYPGDGDYIWNEERVEWEFIPPEGEPHPTLG
jgi:hypothetical protein